MILSKISLLFQRCPFYFRYVLTDVEYQRIYPHLVLLGKRVTEMKKKISDPPLM